MKILKNIIGASLSLVWALARGLPAIIKTHRALQRREDYFEKLDERRGIRSFAE